MILYTLPPSIHNPNSPTLWCDRLSFGMDGAGPMEAKQDEVASLVDELAAKMAPDTMMSRDLAVTEVIAHY